MVIYHADEKDFCFCFFVSVVNKSRYRNVQDTDYLSFVSRKQHTVNIFSLVKSVFIQS